MAPIVRRLAGRNDDQPGTVLARMAVKVNSEIGRTEYLLVGLVQRSGLDDEEISLVAYPMGKGSGSVTTFSRADGFVTIDRQEEIVPADACVTVRLLGRDTRAADLVAIGSHCVGLDLLLGYLQDANYRTKFLAVGSTAGLEAARRGECDVAGIHLLDERTGQYNRPFATSDLELIGGYGRQQGVVFRHGDERFEKKTAVEAFTRVVEDPCCVMVNRNQGSGTRILIDQHLDGRQPNGYAIQARNHNAVAAAVAQGRADWGVAIESVARNAGLGFLHLADEQYDFVIPRSRLARPAVSAFRQLLNDVQVTQALKELGFQPKDVL